jgi:hypothetical protein
MDLEETHGCYPLLQWKHGEVLPTDLAVEEHPEGGANALNLNRCFLSLSHTYIGPRSQNPHDTNGSKQFPVVSIIESSSFLMI